MIIIGFGNKARHGKDSACAAILDHIAKQNRSLARAYGIKSFRAEQFRFAAALYDECRQLHGMTEKDAPLLQRVGAARRAEDENYWVKQVFNKIDGSGLDLALISDVRYKNEAAEVTRRGGYLINLTRVEPNGKDFVAPDRPADHISETDLDGYNWDFYIRTHSGEEALAADLAITIFEFIRGIYRGN